MSKIFLKKKQKQNKLVHLFNYTKPLAAHTVNEKKQQLQWLVTLLLHH